MEEELAPTKKKATKKSGDSRLIYAMLCQPLPEEAIQRTEKAKTKKGYDTTGHGYQWVIDRFNEVMGIDGWRYTYRIIREVEGQFQGGQPRHDITVELGINLNMSGEWLDARFCVGSHVSGNHGDALKGAITNAFKKSASWWGVGREAYAGQLDDDNVTQDEGPTTPVAKETVKEAVSPPKATPGTPTGRPVCPECGQPALMDSKFGEGQYCNPVWGGCKAQIVPIEEADPDPSEPPFLPPEDDIPIDSAPDKPPPKKKLSKTLENALKTVADSLDVSDLGDIYTKYNKKLKGDEQELFKDACMARAEYLKSGEDE
ncbi:hypothetical protein LCGC14_0516850 [marine sediment metagenome]|uniref:Rad52/22 double-strand break repair protein n=1 Tax=marine sediment metagenome TaxID=412755 RepID=A0A0F9UL47_9ZZZZ